MPTRARKPATPEPETGPLVELRNELQLIREDVVPRLWEARMRGWWTQERDLWHELAGRLENVRLVLDGI